MGRGCLWNWAAKRGYVFTQGPSVFRFQVCMAIFFSAKDKVMWNCRWREACRGRGRGAGAEGGKIRGRGGSPSCRGGSTNIMVLQSWIWWLRKSEEVYIYLSSFWFITVEHVHFSVQLIQTEDFVTVSWNAASLRTSTRAIFSIHSSNRLL
jgi:hypothetical protein